MDCSEEFTTSCPIPISDYPNVLLAHGGGGTLMHQLLEKMFFPVFGNPHLDEKHDGAVIVPGTPRIALTTDSYVVKPLFFPGGDIGSLSVHGTVNDLAMCGARAKYLSAGFILEEGLPMETLWRVVRSMEKAAKEAGTMLVTGDTKVVDRGKGDGIFINTAGIGVLPHDLTLSPSAVRPGDAVLLSGDLGRHGIAIMAVRENLSFETTIESDSAPLTDIVMDLVESGLDIHCMRDLTRGGLVSALVEIAERGGVGITIEERAIPVRDDVQGACEILGIDPLFVANEGRFVAFVAPQDAEKALDKMKACSLSAGASHIGQVTEAAPVMLQMRNRIGTHRILDRLSGEQLPRIC